MSSLPRLGRLESLTSPLRHKPRPEARRLSRCTSQKEGTDVEEGCIARGGCGGVRRSRLDDRLGLYVVADGTGRPKRMRIRGPSFMNIASFPYALKGAMLADVVAILGSFDFVMGECDR